MPGISAHDPVLDARGNCPKVLRDALPLSKYMDVAKNRGGPPKWMVKIMEHPIKMDDSGFGNTHIRVSRVVLPKSDLEVGYKSMLLSNLYLCPRHQSTF